MEPILIEQILRILAAAIAGAAIGFEREIKNKPAGFLTFTLVSVGSCLIAILQQNINAANPGTDPSRIIAQVVSGIGFLGAGTILYNRGNVQGITTAAMLWLVAALGLLIGTGGLFNYVIAGTTVIIIIPFAFISRRISSNLSQTKRVHTIRIVFEESREENLIDNFASLGVTIRKTELINKYFQDKIHLKEANIYFNLQKDNKILEVIEELSKYDYVYEVHEN